MNLREKVSDNVTQVKGRIGNWLDMLPLKVDR